ncbi:alanine racemase [Polycladidibacter stylochi]|uniref:alanine racemase n=1 Tax=Polycladidibacter stylochi TaxID=1807766 RepID=UPI000AC734DE|nr:alanine racemase [Pseudovibrio stylochi]
MPNLTNHNHKTDNQPFGVDGAHGAMLTIDPHALANNYLTLKSQLRANTRCAAVVKANAYGVGLEIAAKAFYDAGARDFFVALPQEGAVLRKLYQDVRIFVLAGLLPGMSPFYRQLNLIAVLNSISEVEEQAAFAVNNNITKLAVALQFDSGMKRLGMSEAEAHILSTQSHFLEHFDLQLVMSHLACADMPQDRMNQTQLSNFRQLSQLFPKTPHSLANSSGIFLGADYHFDLVRPGIALYGGNPTPGLKNPMQPVASIHAEVLQIQHLEVGQSVGYGATWQARKPTQVATVSTGYADGYLRSASTSSQRTRGPLAYLKGKYVPIIGRVSMDVLAIDISEFSNGHIKRGDLVELLGKHVLVDELAQGCGTISYEILTGLGQRYQRRTGQL